jgi:hypothetical protein
MREYIKSEERNQSRLIAMSLWSLQDVSYPAVLYSNPKMAPYINQYYRIEEQSSNIDDAYDIILNNQPDIETVDIQFRTTDVINTIVVTKNYIQTDNNPIIKNRISLDMGHSYTSPGELNSSVGLCINSLLQAVLEDTIKLYSQYTELASGRKSAFIGGRTVNKPWLILNDLKIYGNESINTSTLNRVIDGIFNVQKELSNNI